MRIRSTIAVLLLALPLAGCGGGMFGGGFDPTDMFNFLDTKKPLPGDRKAVFPEGVPGVDRGIPQDMVRGNPANQQQQLQQDPQAGQPQGGQPQGAQPQQAAVAPTEQPVTRAAPPPSQRPKATAKRRSVTAPPPDEEVLAPEPAQQQRAPAPMNSNQSAPPAQSSPFPPPMQSGTFSR
jgi:hypothetical protein